MVQLGRLSLSVEASQYGVSMLDALRDTLLHIKTKDWCQSATTFLMITLNNLHLDMLSIVLVGIYHYSAKCY